MGIKPVSERSEPKYPGFRKRKKLYEALAWVIKGHVTLPLCFIFLLACGSLNAQEKTQPVNPPTSQAQNREAQHPCKGKVAMPHPSQDQLETPPCAGVVAPPPCKGEVATPYPPPEPPERFYRVTSLVEFYANARTYVGLRLRITGTLGRMRSGPLIDQGYYIFQESTGSQFGNMYGCPLIGSGSSISEGSQVTVEGTVVRRRGNPAGGPRGTYYALQIEQIYSSSGGRNF